MLQDGRRAAECVFSLTHTLSISLSLTRSVTLSLSLSFWHSHSLSHSLSLFRSLSLTLSLSHSLTLSLSHSLSLWHSLTLSLSHSLSLFRGAKGSIETGGHGWAQDLNGGERKAFRIECGECGRCACRYIGGPSRSWSHWPGRLVLTIISVQFHLHECS